MVFRTDFFGLVCVFLTYSGICYFDYAVTVHMIGGSTSYRQVVVVVVQVVAVVAYLSRLKYHYFEGTLLIFTHHLLSLLTSLL